MNAIVTIINDTPVTTSLAIAEGTDVEHKAVIQLVRSYQNDLEEFGRVTFEMRPFETAGGVQQREIAILNEQQSTLILTYMRNSEIVRTFKKRLVKSFYELAHKQKPATRNKLSPTIKDEVWFLKESAKLLRLPQDSLVTGLHSIAKKHQLTQDFLPVYTSTPLTKSLTDLLKDAGSSISAQSANITLEKAGILERLERSKSGGAKERFWNITAKGLAYGINNTYPDQPNKTQPLWFVSKFNELFAIITNDPSSAKKLEVVKQTKD